MPYLNRAKLNSYFLRNGNFLCFISAEIILQEKRNHNYPQIFFNANQITY